MGATWSPVNGSGAGAEDGGKGVSDEELLRWVGDIAKARGRVQAARDVGLNYRTLARALDDQTLTRFVRETLLEAHQAESASTKAEETGETSEELVRRVEAAEAHLADALGALDQERERAEALERRLELVEERQASEPGAEQPAGEPQAEQLAIVTSMDQSAAENAAVPGSAPDTDQAHRPGVVTLQPLDGEEASFGKAAALVAEWRRLRGADTQRGSAVERARAEERRWELEVELIAEHGLALPPEAEPLHPSRREDQLRWRRVTLRRVHGQRVRAERRRLLRRILTLGLWRR